MPEDGSNPPSAPDLLAGGGEMGEMIRAHDWASTPLGPPQAWPAALKLSASICLGSRFPMVLWWGPQLVMLYNDAWRPVLGETKHPAGLGRPGAETWPEIWDIIGAQMHEVMLRGEATWSVDQLLEVDRYGYLEEAYFTYSYSPIKQLDGTIGGVFTAVSETTERVLGERRLRVLRELSERTANAQSVEQACAQFVSVLGDANPDLPFALVHVRDEDSDGIRLMAASGLGPDWTPPPSDCDPWRVSEVIRTGQAATLRDLSFAGLPAGQARAALVLPIAHTGEHTHTAGALVAGINPRRALDDAYRGFLELVAAQMATAIASARAYQQERRRAEALAEIDRVKTAFFANVSHEFRTPLTLMLGPIEDALANPALPGPQHRALEIAYRNALRLLKLVNSLLDFSRIEAGRMQAVYAPADLAALTAELSSMFRAAVEQAGLTLRVDCPPLGEPVHVDRDMWEKIILNLLSNAFKFTFQGGIDVSLRGRGGMAELAVRDTGIGIPAGELEHLFDRFHRVEGARGRTFEGTGIGLALVQDLARLHGGAVRVQSTPGEGSLFTVTVPLGVAHIPPEQLSAAARAPDGITSPAAAAYVAEALRWGPEAEWPEGSDPIPQTGAPAAPDGGTVLIADDNADMRDYLRQLLGQRYQVRVAADGEAALESIRESRPDLLLSDVMMPRLDGVGLIRALRADPHLADLPVILLSARAGGEASEEGLAAGADDYLVKPFAARELLARIASTLQLARIRRAANEQERALQRTGERFRVALRHAPVTVYNCDRALRYTWVANPVGFAAEDVLGRRDDDLLLPDDAARLTAFKRSVLDSGQPARATMPLQVQGRAMCFDITIEPLRDEDGAVAGLTVAAIDITEQTEAAAELRRLNETLEQRVREAVDAREAAQIALAQAQRLEALGQLAGGIAHDFNNVLQAVTGGLHLITRRAGDADAVRQIAGMAANAAARGAAITGRLLAFGRRDQLRAEPVRVCGLFSGMQEMLAHTLGAGVAVAVDAGEPGLCLLADRGQLETVLVNLAVNARDAMPGGGTLNFAASLDIIRDDRPDGLPDRLPDGLPDGLTDGLAPGAYVRITVADSGVGMDPATLARAAEPFFTTKPVGQGTGLGLAMARGFAQQSGGGFRVDSAPGRGARISLWFPRTDAAVSPVAAQPDGTAEMAAPVAARALVVDDDRMVREMLASQLTAGGHAVTEASDGLAALSRLDRGEDFDLLVTDFAMPGMNGLALIRQARQRLPALPACLLTGFADDSVRLDPAESAGDLTLLLRKPVTGEELLKAAAALLARTRP